MGGEGEVEGFETEEAEERRKGNGAIWFWFGLLRKTLENGILLLNGKTEKGWWWHVHTRHHNYKYECTEISSFNVS